MAARKKKEEPELWQTYGLRFDPEEFRRKLKIDKHNLDEEVEIQPQLYGEIAEAAAYAKSEVERLKDELKQTEAEVDKSLRRDAEKAEEKITEAAIKAEIASDDDVRDCVLALHKAEDIQRRLEALSTAFRQRSYMIRDMVDLHLAGYYQSSSAKGSAGNIRDAEVDRVTSKMAERRTTRVGGRRKRLPKSR